MGTLSIALEAVVVRILDRISRESQRGAIVMQEKTDIHDRIIARLEALRSCDLGRLHEDIPTLIDMAIDNVRRKCPTCRDTGIKLLGQFEPSMTRKAENEYGPCDCNRPAQLAEWERLLGGVK